MMPADTRHPSSRTRAAGRVLFILALVVATLVSAGGITDERAVSLQGDMPRYMMDGVFLQDLAGASHGWSASALEQYATEYYARYPALSIGHHPPLLPMVLAASFAVFGASVWAARLVTFALVLLSVVLLYLVTRRLYDAVVAGWACLLFATQPYLGGFAQSVLSEPLAIALVLAAMFYLVRFRESSRAYHYFLFVAAAILSLTARQLAIFLFPAYALLLVLDGTWRHMRQRTILLWTAAGLTACLVVGIATLILSPFNVEVIRSILEWGGGPMASLGALRVIARAQIGVPLLVVLGIGVLTSIAARDRRFTVAGLWMLSVLAGVVFVTGIVEPPRYSILAVPAYCIAGATIAARRRPRWVAVAGSMLLAVCVAWQGMLVARVRPVGAGGYEAAARFVLDHQPGPTVLFSGSVDTGYFVFFVRKHDAARHLVVLRSDKILTTSEMASLSVEDRISAPSQIYPLLQQYGTRYVVVEDHRTSSVVLNWLLDELHTPHFAERCRFPTDSTDRRLAGVDVVVYEYLDATPPAPDATLDLKLPVVGREILVPLSDLTSGGRTR
jgi:hypothetical protein